MLVREFTYIIKVYQAVPIIFILVFLFGQMGMLLTSPHSLTHLSVSLSSRYPRSTTTLYKATSSMLPRFGLIFSNISEYVYLSYLFIQLRHDFNIFFSWFLSPILKFKKMTCTFKNMFISLYNLVISTYTLNGNFFATNYSFKIKFKKPEIVTISLVSALL